MVRIDSNLAENYGHIFMKIFISREDELNESRVASTPSVVKDLIKLGYQVQVQSGAGAKASFSDLAYSEAGAEIVDDWSVSANADILLMVRLPSVSKLEILGSGQSIISFVWPSQNSSVLDFCAAKGINLIAMDCIPRISRAQKMDALSSMANIGGYRAVIEAANQFGRFFTGQITAAGKINPAKIFRIVDLPEPDGPTIASFSPSLSLRFRFLRTFLVPQFIDRLFVSTTGVEFFKINL